MGIFMYDANKIKGVPRAFYASFSLFIENRAMKSAGREVK